MKKVLFIGNSHTYFNDMPQMVKELANAAGEELHVTMLTKAAWILHGTRSRNRQPLTCGMVGMISVFCSRPPILFPGRRHSQRGQREFVNWRESIRPGLPCT